jgi:hypothetical protein
MQYLTQPPVTIYSLACRSFFAIVAVAGNLPVQAGFTVMMTNERKIWEAALMLVRRHGSDALQVAEREAERLRTGDDELSCIVWCWIARSTAELLRPTPDNGERVH